MDLGGRAAIVTGAAAGIGRAIALRLAAEGAAILAVDRDEAAAKVLIGEIHAGGGTASALAADVSDGETAAGLGAVCNGRFGRLDVLVNNAGGVEGPTYPDNAPTRWRAVIELNLMALMAATQGVLPFMEERGSGVIVNISSAAALGARPHPAPEYAAAKAGVMRLTSALGSLASSRGIRVNCICPDWVDTPASRRTVAAMAPEQRLAVPPEMLTSDQVATAVQFLIENDEQVGAVLVWRCGDAVWRRLDET